MPFGLPSAGAAFTLHELTPALLVGSVVLLVSVAAVRLSTKSGLPSLLLYLGIGLVIGEAGFGIRFDSGELTQVLGYSALILILSEGGLSTRWEGIRRAVAPAAVLSTVGVLVSVFVVALAARYVLHLDWDTALLVGAILSSTDAAAVFSVLRRVPLPRRVTGMLEAESGFNDAPVVILVTALAARSADPSGADPWWHLLGLAVFELAVGAAIGLAVGWLGAQFMRRVASGSSGLFSLGVVAVTVLAYAAAASVHTSGFIACYLAALLLGNLHLPHRPAVQGLSTALGWLAQIGLFVLLGLLAAPGHMSGQVLPAIVIGLVLLLVARPLSVLVSVAPFRLGWRDQVFLSWAGLRGAVPVVLATVPATMGARGVDWIFELVFVLVVIFTIVQGPTLPWVAQRLGIVEDHSTLDLAVEATPLEELGAEVIQVTVGPASKLHGVDVFELRLPEGANVTLVVRGGEGFVPASNTVIRRGDQLLIVATAATRARAEKRVRAVSTYGRLAGWTERVGQESGAGSAGTRRARLRFGLPVAREESGAPAAGSRWRVSGGRWRSGGVAPRDRDGKK
ncbi:potassium/proton antiporter [Phycicoccus sp. 3266]|uniref:potassium/proton antiporter n=1 Tax=Phycicoccus sp. 3266 TaxID=2817751 RepID=UPI002864CA51|nr:potassium/proton antiporter [Phycicoccus sp. 3266]MDR6862713.1 cell volume regulation protein A [Phycicoccus sp. 3266]